ncbi:Tn3 family transposase [Rhizobium leguminosarum]|uniref:Tn3 family transposase n=1 Tax=Rhizobium leguminosarum TaxID=384 RepID=UPI0028F419DA|nr:Tn3 family transposase [Rhizobium leguminosarum]
MPDVKPGSGDEQEVSALALHLLQVSLVYVDTRMLQTVLVEPKWAGRMTLEDYRSLTPLIYSHVTSNAYGRFDLDLNSRIDLGGWQREPMEPKSCYNNLSQRPNANWDFRDGGWSHTFDPSRRRAAIKDCGQARRSRMSIIVSRTFGPERNLPSIRLTQPAQRLKRVAIFQIHSSRFRSLFLRKSLSQNRCTLLRDML